MNSARVIKHSVSPGGKEIVTMVVTFPRYILAEFNTHRVFSKNTASSRAIPVSKFIKQLEEDPVFPTYWGKNQSGMKAVVELCGEDIIKAVHIWENAKYQMIDAAKKLQGLEVHKQITNRLLETWFFVTVLVTSTEWNNFFKLRCSSDAQPEMKQIADMMRKALSESTAHPLDYEQWHIPFGEECFNLSLVEKLKVATARAARVSYVNFNGEIDPAKDLSLHDDLKNSGHWSPFEHCAQALRPLSFLERLFAGVKFIFGRKKCILNRDTGNFRGWLQYRKTFSGESGE